MSVLFDIRINALRAYLENGKAALITNEVNIGYFTGFFHSEGCFLVTKENAYLLVDFRYYEAAQSKAHGCEVICFKKLSESVLQVLKNDGVNCVEVEANHMTFSRADFFKKIFQENGISFISDGKLDKQIEKQRIIKDPSEIDNISAAQKIAEKAYLEMLNDVKPGVKERELSARLEYYMKQFGAEDISFDLITISGKKTSLPHGVPSDNEIKDGDFFTCDFGAVYEGYHSDTTRTVAIGHATDEMQKIYGIVLQAQLSALEKVKAGVRCSEIDKTARDIITEAGYGENFGHSTGHGVGLDIHEAPFVSSKSESILQAGMIITDEPGIYLPDKFGVRIEDMLCVTEDGCINFAKLPKELIII